MMIKSFEVVITFGNQIDTELLDVKMIKDDIIKVLYIFILESN